MKVTIDLDPELYRAVKVEAARADRSVRDIVDEALAAWLERLEEAEDAAAAAEEFFLAHAPPAQRPLRKLPPDATARARGPILALGRDAPPPGAVVLAGSSLWRLRVGDIRIVYAIDEVARAVVVLRVARRSESTYRRVR